VCEALFRAKIHPATSANALGGGNGAPSSRNTKNDVRLTPLAIHIRQVLEEALDAGGSTLKDYKSVEGESGYFQHNFDVYGREDKKCRTAECDGIIERIVQAGRSSFFCPNCQPL